MQLQSVHLHKADRILRDALMRAAPGERVRAILILTQPDGSKGIAPPQPSAFKSRVEYRKAAIRFQEALLEQVHGPVLEALRSLGLNPAGEELMSAVVVEGTAHQILEALELNGVEKGIADRAISVEVRRATKS